MNKVILLQTIRQYCSENPRDLSEIIKAATAGVEEFAQKQSDGGSKMAFIMTEILNNNQQEKFGVFSRKDLIESTKPWLEGTVWYNEQTGGQAAS